MYVNCFFIIKEEPIIDLRDTIFMDIHLFIYIFSLKVKSQSQRDLEDWLASTYIK